MFYYIQFSNLNQFCFPEVPGGGMSLTNYVILSSCNDFKKGGIVIYISTLLIVISFWLRSQQDINQSYSLAYVVVSIMLVVTLTVSLVRALRNKEIKKSEPLKFFLLILGTGLIIFKLVLYGF